MADFDTEYHVQIEIDTSLLNDTARTVIPEMIQQFAIDLRNRMAFLGTAGAYKFAATEQSPRTSFDTVPLSLEAQEE